jgi:DNA-binding NarL/FixJ family response regulator
VLVVDDDARFRALVVTMLEREGYQTFEAASGDEALLEADRRCPDLVLLDIQLPGTTGYEVCRKLRDEFGEGLPIIFISGERTEPLDRVGGLLLGADDYVVKPFDANELVSRVRRALTRSVPEKPQATADAAAFGLTGREQDVLRLLSEGLTPKEIARALFISRKTVSTHLQHIMLKLGVHSQAQAVTAAFRNKLVERESSFPRARS